MECGRCAGTGTRQCVCGACVWRKGGGTLPSVCLSVSVSVWPGLQECLCLCLCLCAAAVSRCRPAVLAPTLKMFLARMFSMHPKHTLCLQGTNAMVAGRSSLHGAAAGSRWCRSRPAQHTRTHQHTCDTGRGPQLCGRAVAGAQVKGLLEVSTVHDRRKTVGSDNHTPADVALLVPLSHAPGGDLGRQPDGGQPLAPHRRRHRRAHGG